MALIKREKAIVEGIEVEVLEFSDTVETVEKASRLSNEGPDSIIKTILLRGNHNYFIAIARGDRKIDFKKATQLLGTNLVLANPKEVSEVLGVEV
ncbi:MAG: YbaK/EbsC family protein, partial [Desulfurococcaceae archaeon]